MTRLIMGGQPSTCAADRTDHLDGLYSEDRYFGNIVDGWRHGKGTYLYPSGDVYSGDWVFNVRSGWGVYIVAATGEKYEGQWRNGFRHGLGTQACASGFRYFGEFSDDQKSGKILSICRT